MGMLLTKLFFTISGLFSPFLTPPWGHSETTSHWPREDRYMKDSELDGGGMLAFWQKDKILFFQIWPCISWNLQGLRTKILWVAQISHTGAWIESASYI